jgi:hypothetical protein
VFVRCAAAAAAGGRYDGGALLDAVLGIHGAAAA